VGVIPLGLAWVGIRSHAAQKPVRRWLIVGLGMTGIALAWPGLRLLAATALALALLAGFGLQALLEDHEQTTFHWLPRRSAPWIALMLVELLALAMTRNVGVALSAFDPSKPALAWLEQQRAAQPGSPFRVEMAKAPHAYAGSPLAMQGGLDEVAADDALLTPRSRSALEQLGDAAQKGSALLALRYYLRPADQPAPAAGWRQVFPAAGQTAPMVVDENPAAMSRAWTAPAAVGFPTVQEARQRTGKMDFDPHQLVVGDWQLSADQIEWMTRPWDPFVDLPEIRRPTCAGYFTHRANPPSTAPGENPQPRIAWMKMIPSACICE
jgi:hypothetical protein